MYTMCGIGSPSLNDSDACTDVLTTATAEPFRVIVIFLSNYGLAHRCSERAFATFTD